MLAETNARWGSDRDASGEGLDGGVVLGVCE